MKTQICTSIEQSKRLIKLGIDVYTADCWHHLDVLSNEYILWTLPFNHDLIDGHPEDVFGWSLHNLLSFLPDTIQYSGETYFLTFNTKNVCYYESVKGVVLETYKGNNLYDNIINALEFLLNNNTLKW